MEILFIIIIIFLAVISIWEYFTGKVIDIAFTHMLALQEEVKGKFLGIVLSEFFIWVIFLAFIFMTYRMLFVIGLGDLRRVRTYFIVIFFIIVLPFAMVRKWYASWVKKTTVSCRKNNRSAV